MNQIGQFNSMVRVHSDITLQTVLLPALLIGSKGSTHLTKAKTDKPFSLSKDFLFSILCYMYFLWCVSCSERLPLKPFIEQLVSKWLSVRVWQPMQEDFFFFFWNKCRMTFYIAQSSEKIHIPKYYLYPWI